MSSKTADKSTVTAGDKVTYTLNLYNSGVKDKRIYLEDNYTQGMIFDKIILDTNRFIKWRENTTISDDILAYKDAPDYHYDYIQKISFVDNSLSVSVTGGNDDLYTLLSGNST